MTFPFPVRALTIAEATLSGVLVYRSTQTDTSDASSYSFSSAIGAASADRSVVVAIEWTASGVKTVSSIVCNGVTLTPIRARSTISNTAAVAQYIGAVPTGITGSFTVTMSGTCTNCVLHVYTSDTPSLGVLHIVEVAVNASVATLTDLRTVIGGSIVGVLTNNGTEAITPSYNGSDSLVSDYNSTVESVRRVSTHALTTETVATNDVTFTGSSSAAKEGIGVCYGALSGSAYAPVLADHWTDGVDASSFSYAGKSTGTANANRQTLICFGWEAAATRTVTSVTVDGNAATKVDAREGVSGGAAIYRYPNASGTTATIAITLSGTATRLGVGIYDTRPRGGSNAAIDLGNNGVTATSVSVADIEVYIGGFLIMVGRTASASDDNVSTYNGVDTLTRDVQDTIETARFTYWSCLTTEFATANDPGYSSTNSLARSVAAASWI